MRFKVPMLLAASALLAAMIVPSMASAHGTHLKAKMNGKKVVGSAGAPNGSGRTTLHILRNNRRVCFHVKYSRIGGRDGLNIAVYRGRRGQNGNLKFTLVNEALKSPLSGCVRGLRQRLVRRIASRPGQFHVNVKNSTFPTNGAIRGQLRPV